MDVMVLVQEFVGLMIHVVQIAPFCFNLAQAYLRWYKDAKFLVFITLNFTAFGQILPQSMVCHDRFDHITVLANMFVSRRF